MKKTNTQQVVSREPKTQVVFLKNDKLYATFFNSEEAWNEFKGQHNVPCYRKIDLIIFGMSQILICLPIEYAKKAWGKGIPMLPDDETIVEIPHENLETIRNPDCFLEIVDKGVLCASEFNWDSDNGWVLKLSQELFRKGRWIKLNNTGPEITIPGGCSIRKSQKKFFNRAELVILSDSGLIANIPWHLNQIACN